MEGREWDFAAEMVDGEIGECPLLYVSFPSLKDPLYDPGPELRHTGEIVTFVPYDTFAPWVGTEWRKRGADYEALKQQLTDRIMKQLERMPQLESVIVMSSCRRLCPPTP